MNRIIFTEEEDSREIIGMISTQPEADPETVYFVDSVMAEGPVESWLGDIENQMVLSLYTLTKDAIAKYPEDDLNRNEWFFNHAA